MAPDSKKDFYETNQGDFFERSRQGSLDDVAQYIDSLLNARSSVSCLLGVNAEGNESRYHKANLSRTIQEFIGQTDMKEIKTQISNALMTPTEPKVNEKLKMTLAYYAAIISAYDRWHRDGVTLVCWDISDTMGGTGDNGFQQVPYLPRLLQFLETKYPEIKNGILTDMESDRIDRSLPSNDPLKACFQQEYILSSSRLVKGETEEVQDILGTQYQAALNRIPEDMLGEIVSTKSNAGMKHIILEQLRSRGIKVAMIDDMTKLFNFESSGHFLCVKGLCPIGMF